MLKEIITAIQAYFQTHRFIIKHRLWKWILIPGLVYTILFCAGIWLFLKSSNYAIDFVLLKTGATEWMQKMQNSWLNWLMIFAQIILYLVLLLFYFSLFKYMFLIVGSPLFAYLSEKTEAIMEGHDFPFSFSQLIKDIIRGVRIALRNMLWQTVYAVSIFILAFIPVIGWITPLIALLVECYYLGFSMLDYSCERHKLSTSQSIAFIGKHRGLAIGNGLVFYMMHFIPLLGWVLAPGYAVIAATISLYGDKEGGVSAMVRQA
ncbi:EI24 domain-containing protein [Ferruginibacter sp. SUN106]|uniref:EI24 domain-containing protein n=1 Tax=Ferruginibacter sp. SUN106 TaxID=2978348 RepID=UPI003D368E1E